MDALRCGTCRVQFNKSELHREHFKSDWHLYNIKRKVIKLDPITIDDFVQRQQIQSGSCTSSEFGETDWYCVYCSKKFASKRAWINHCASRQHQRKESDHVNGQLEKVKSLNRKAAEKGEQKPTRDQVNELLRSPVRARRHVTSWGQGDSPRNQWLRKMNIYDDSDDEMLDEDPEMWSDVDSTYSVGSSIHPGGEQRNIELDECLFCGVISSSFDQNLGHMSVKHDFRFPDEEFVVSPEELFFFCADKVGNGNICLVCNYAGRAFYSLQAVRNHMVTKGHCYVNVNGENALDYVEFYDFAQSGDDPAILRAELMTEKAEAGGKGQHQGFELVLPSGAVLGHRLLHRYFRQGNTTTAIVPKVRANVRPHYRAIGNANGNEPNTSGDLRKIWQYKNKALVKNAVRNNKVMMKHFRDRNGFCQ